MNPQPPNKSATQKILELLAIRPGGLTAKSLVSLTGLSKSTVCRSLKGLREANRVQASTRFFGRVRYTWVYMLC